MYCITEMHVLKLVPNSLFSSTRTCTAREKMQRGIVIQDRNEVGLRVGKYTEVHLIAYCRKNNVQIPSG